MFQPLLKILCFSSDACFLSMCDRGQVLYRTLLHCYRQLLFLNVCPAVVSKGDSTTAKRRLVTLSSQHRLQNISFDLMTDGMSLRPCMDLNVYVSMGWIHMRAVTVILFCHLFLPMLSGCRLPIAHTSSDEHCIFIRKLGCSLNH